VFEQLDTFKSKKVVLTNQLIGTQMIFPVSYARRNPLKLQAMIMATAILLPTVSERQKMTSRMSAILRRKPR